MRYLAIALHVCLRFMKLFHRGISPAGGHSTFFGLLNTFVHIVMLLVLLRREWDPPCRSTFGGNTVLQMVQFVLVFLHAFQLLFIECDYPRASGGSACAVLFYYLFSDFYKQAYIKKTRVRRLHNSECHHYCKQNGISRQLKSGFGVALAFL
ncbi:Elongation of very long chain fatty acids protein AAEL008004 [Eumeta japonica]|uniref:Elongation of very long chain fatty acids protein n=1 Tax=Eumeta variegata TaxID=151549 RepID=A0A4C2AH54_EUMVA|nr:Elongation of very long chain fatty acids protein AAEL008004 [Eumeta japonica]